MGFKDFAGGCVIHASTGTAALVVIKFLAPRERSRSSRKLGHHNLLLSMLGSSIIWGGWYSFNGGSAYAANEQAAGALLNTHLSACAGSSMWLILFYWRTKKYSLLEIMSGALAGLGSITAGSGFVTPSSAFLIGMTGGFFSSLWVSKIKPRMKLDDTLDVWALQGIPGLIGTFSVSLFSTKNSINGADGVFYGGNWSFMGVQLLGMLVTTILSLTGTSLVMLLVKYLLGGKLDVTAAVEEKGLDLIQIGEQAYDTVLPPLLDIGSDALLLKLNEACMFGNLERVKSLISDGANPLGSDYDGRTPGTFISIMYFEDIF
jgi:Amt family ammonium transporter